MRIVLAILVALLVAAGATYVIAGRAGGPSIEIAKPDKYLGLSSPLEIVVDTPKGQLSSLRVALEQNGKRTELYTLDSLAGAIKQESADRLRITRDVGRHNVPDLKAGDARIIVTAARPVLYGIRQSEKTATRDVKVRLERPRVAVISTHHYVNLGGSEMVVYRATPEDVQSGVVVGDIEYRGFPASGVKVQGINITDPAIRVAFFALRFDQDLNTPIKVFARDEAGNTARADFDFRTFPKPFKKSTIQIEDKFIDRVVPAILDGTTEIRPDGSNVEKFVAINSELRKKNNAKIASFAAQTSPELLWGGDVFYVYANNAVEAAFADARTYVYQGKEIDRQVHLGFDLASFTSVPVVAANRGKVLFADELGIYGNAVIVDHGMGVQSLYAHFSSIGVKVGDVVNKGQELGRSGMTGLAQGDHLHFTMLVDGQMVNPVEWWDSHWIEDRILRKLREAGGIPAAAPTR
jgi:murein DD-endopeptidase MepM/ murein hydrolase activator NlpD